MVSQDFNEICIIQVKCGIKSSYRNINSTRNLTVEA